MRTGDAICIGRVNTSLALNMSIRSTTRRGTSYSDESISRGCTALANWSSVCCAFGLAWTRASLTNDNNWRVAVTSSCVCWGKRWTLRATVVTVSVSTHPWQGRGSFFFVARHSYARASVSQIEDCGMCPSHAVVESKLITAGSCVFRRRIAQWL